jgi:hypothetical protein
MAARNPFASSIPDIYDAYAPYSYQSKRLSTGYYVVRNLLIVGALCGGFVALYRNDVLRDLARRVGQEPRYLAAEQFLVGTPGWGTPRSMEPVLADDGTAPAATPEAVTGVAPVAAPPAAPPEPPVAAAPTAETPHAPAAAPIPPPPTETHAPAPVAAAPPPVAAPPPAAAPAPAPAPAHAPVAAAPIDPLAPVKFESLPLVGQQVPRAVSFNDLPTAHAAAPAPAPRSAAPAPVAARPAPARPAPSPAPRANGKAFKVSLDDAPASHAATARSIPAPSRAAPPPEPKPEPAPGARKPAPPPGPKATEARASDNPLLAAVRGAVRTRPAKESVPAAK